MNTNMQFKYIASAKQDKISVSILGDSVSTYEGFNPSGYDVFYELGNRQRSHLDDVSETWWYKVIAAINGRLLVNNSYSGSRVSGDAFPAANSYDRLKALTNDMITPDVILIYIGFNDFGYGVKVKAFL